jgi:hypothetical protein
LIPPEVLDRRAAMAAMPALIKAYLRLGGFVGQGAFVDHAFNTTDVCLMMDTGRMSDKHRDFYIRKQAGHENAGMSAGASRPIAVDRRGLLAARWWCCAALCWWS